MGRVALPWKGNGIEPGACSPRERSRYPACALEGRGASFHRPFRTAGIAFPPDYLGLQAQGSIPLLLRSSDSPFASRRCETRS